MKTYDLISSFDNIYLCGTDRCMPDNTSVRLLKKQILIIVYKTTPCSYFPV